MGAYNSQNGFIPSTFDELITLCMEWVNTVFKTSYNYDTFRGSNFYKFVYVPVQLVMYCENIFSQIFEKYLDYIKLTNEKIAIPKTPREGLIQAFNNAGFEVSLENTTEDNAGTLGVCVNTPLIDDDVPADIKQQIVNIMNTYTVAGLFYNGNITGSATLSNGQTFDYSFTTPTIKQTWLRITITPSNNSGLLVDTIAVVKQRLLDNIAARYKLGNDFAPDIYYTIDRDAPYASKILLEYSFTSDEATDFTNDVYAAAYTDLLTFSTDNIEVIIG